MVTIKKLDNAIFEAQRFLKAARVAKALIKQDSSEKYGGKATGAVKRASMDLTRALVPVRE